MVDYAAPMSNLPNCSNLETGSASRWITSGHSCRATHIVDMFHDHEVDAQRRTRGYLRLHSAWTGMVHPCASRLPDQPSAHRADSRYLRHRRCVSCCHACRALCCPRS